ncbi:conserved hypothetical protein [Tenacibaculum litopenaei]|jgi:hypothetical protein|uniref:hypothetical protein n=1 Tax=Tenacibaculum litopenaei TaxID=396016 RepID=UPI0038937369
METNTLTEKHLGVLGGWTKYRKLNDEDLAVWEATPKPIGVNYAPYEVASQVVSGMNYKFKTVASIPHADVEWPAIVEIYKPLDEPPYITGITRL